jgi:hypothetical protein
VLVDVIVLVFVIVVVSVNDAAAMAVTTMAVASSSPPPPTPPSPSASVVGGCVVDVFVVTATVLNVVTVSPTVTVVVAEVRVVVGSSQKIWMLPHHGTVHRPPSEALPIHTEWSPAGKYCGEAVASVFSSSLSAVSTLLLAVGCSSN